MPIISEYSNELTHYGRLGMKWGQHLFGKDDSGTGVKRRKRLDLRAKLRARKEKKQERLRKAAEEQELARRKAILSNAKLLDKYKDEFTTDEINRAIERFRAEKNLKAVANETHAERMKELRKGYDYTKAIVDYTAASMNAYNNFAKIYNTFSSDDKKRLAIIGEKPNQSNQDEEKKKP